jgi:hypothetical protein
MQGEARFTEQFAAAQDVMRLRREAVVFQEVVDIARGRGDVALQAVAERYRDDAITSANAHADGLAGQPPIPENVMEVARVAGRHPTQWTSGSTMAS